MQDVTGESACLAKLRAEAKPPAKALILDDNAFDRRHLHRVLRATLLPLDVTETSSAAELSAALETARFDVAFIDYVLPTGNGLEALEILRGHAVNHRCAAILVTGDDRSDVAVRALQLGCADYIAKDKLSAGALRRRVIRVLRAGERRFSHETRAEEELARHADALQSGLAHVIRDMRALRARSATEESDITADLQRIEQQFLGIWARLLDATSLAAKGPRH